MKINSSCCAIFTPVKGESSTGDKVTPGKDNQSDYYASRPSRLPAPAKEHEPILVSMRKSHAFLAHGAVKYSELEKRGVSISSVAEIREFFQEEMPDLNDGVLKKEEEAIQDGEFTEKMKRFIAEEFDVPSEYSFLTVCLLLYCSEHSLSVSESFNELNLFESGFECEKCSILSEDQNVEENNLQILKSVMNKSAQADCDEDSYDDPPFNPETINTSESEFSELSQIVNPLNVDSSFESVQLFNPFEKTLLPSSDIINSTLMSNAATSPRRQFPNESSPIQHQKKREINCKNCGRNFSKMHNLKMHMVSVHKVFPSGMKIFKCPYPECSFVAGNKVIFERHSHKKNVVGAQSKVLCDVCHEKFANKHSLARHKTRRHKSLT